MINKMSWSEAEEQDVFFRENLEAEMAMTPTRWVERDVNGFEYEARVTDSWVSPTPGLSWIASEIRETGEDGDLRLASAWMLTREERENTLETWIKARQETIQALEDIIYG